MENKLNILWMYPDILNLHGDRGNLMAFERIAKKLNVEVNIKKVEKLTDKIDLNDIDLMFFNVGEIKVMPAIIEALNQYKEQIKKFIDNNRTIIFIGASGCIAANKTIRKDSEFKGLELLNMELRERDKIYGDDILFTLKEDGTKEIVGCQIKMLDTILNSDIELGILEYGSGNNGFVNKTEGAKYKNVIYTNALGPVFVKNPWYTEKIIKECLKNKDVIINECLKDEDIEIESQSLKYIKEFINKKGEKDVS